MEHAGLVFAHDRDWVLILRRRRVGLANLPFLLALVAVPLAGRDRVHPQAPVVAAARAPVAEHEVLLAVESPAHEAGNILELRG